MDKAVVKRGRGRPPGSLNQSRPPIRSPEATEVLKRHLAGAYAEAVAGHALASDRKRRVRTSIRQNFGRNAFVEIEQAIQAAEELLLPDSAARDENDLLGTSDRHG